MAQEKFLIDANAFMTPHLQYYPFDLAPSFWAGHGQFARLDGYS